MPAIDEKRKQIREGLDIILDNPNLTVAAIGFLNEEGVVIKVDRELPSEYTNMGNLKYGGMMANDILEAGYTAFEPLIED